MTAPMWVIFVIDIAGALCTIVLCLMALTKMKRIYKARKHHAFYTYLHAQTIALVIFAVSRSGGHILKHILLTFGYNDIWKAIAPVSGSINSFAFIGFGIAAIMYSNVREITQRVDALEQSRAEIRQSLEEKKVLLGEIHHRVKNNMAVITALLQMQAAVIEDASFRQTLIECENRVRSMALVHEKLYKSKNFSEINLLHYVTELVNDLKHSYGRDDVEVSVNVGDIHINLDKLVSFGLIINEIVSNSFKYAFIDTPEPKLQINIIEENGSAVMELSDNGPGFDEMQDNSERKTLGLNIVDALMGQIRGKIIRETGKGVKYKITFPLTD